MKQALTKLQRIFKKNKKGGDKTSVPRITNETLAENREAVLRQGKRFKYPLQQTKKRTVIISVVLVLLLFAATSVFTWYQLYVAQSTSEFTYRITLILPLSVGKVDGRPVPYSRYLTYLRSSLYYLSTKEAVNLQSDNGQRQLAYQKRQAMNRVLEQTLVSKIASEQNIVVTDKEVDNFINSQIQSNELGATKKDLVAVIDEYYDWNFQQYRQSIKEELLRKKVVSAISGDTRQTGKKILSKLSKKKKAPDFSTLAKQYSDDAVAKQTGGDVGFIPVKSPDPEGLVDVASKLRDGEVSGLIEGTDGLYIVKTIEKRSGEVHFARIFLKFRAFEERFNILKKKGKVHEYIKIPELNKAPAPNH